MPDAAANPFPVACFFQPARNVALMASWGINTFFGPEVESPRNLTPGALAAAKVAWVKAVEAAGARCVLKLGADRPATLPASCAGLLLSVDEPNAKINKATGYNYVAADLQPEVDDLRARYPGVQIWVSLAGDKITSANLKKQHEWDALAAWLNLTGFVTVDVYDNNRNASRYPETWEADVVKTVKAVAPAVKCLSWHECNDQQLAAPTSQTVPGVPDVNREPTPDEIKQSVDAAIAQGADGIGWFFTCDSGKYGWGVGNTDFATRGDSYLPLVNRRGESMAPQYAMVRQISKALNPPDPGPLPGDDDLAARVAEMDEQLMRMAQQLDELQQTATAQRQTLAEVMLKFNAIAEVIRPTAVN